MLEIRRVGAKFRTGAATTEPTAENRGLTKTAARFVAGFSHPAWHTAHAVAFESET